MKFKINDEFLKKIEMIIKPDLPEIRYGRERTPEHDSYRSY